MMKILLLLSACIVSAASQCPNTQEAFHRYLMCIKGKLDGDYGNFESELQADERKAIDTCFASSLPSGQAQHRCVLSLRELEHHAWSKNGPMRDCALCLTFANAAIKALHQTSEGEIECIRTSLIHSLTKEASFCLQRTQGATFTALSNFPDLDEASFPHKDKIVKTTSDFIMAHSRLTFCSKRNPQFAAATSACMTKPFPGFLSKHCDAAASCSRAIPSNCAASVSSARAAACQCIAQGRAGLQKRVQNIGAIIRRAVAAGGSADQCVADVSSSLVTPSNNWVQVIDGIIHKCVRKATPLSLESLFKVGCRKALTGKDGEAAKLDAGFDFLGSLVDAIADRAERFCDGAHCH